MEIQWYFNKDFRFATIQNWKENGPKLVMDYTRYNQPYKEPSGNVIERHWDILDIINQKYGKGTLIVGSSGLRGDQRAFSMKQERRTPAYTTKWEDMPSVRA